MNTLGERKWHPPKDAKISMICYLYRSGEGDDSLARSFDSYELRRVCESVPAAEDDLNTLFTEAWNSVLVEPLYPRLRMYLRPRVLAAVTPFAKTDISSKAIGGMYFIVVNLG